MPALASELRNKLERVVIEARDVAEAGARAALEALGVHHHQPYPHMKAREKALRNHLRARARQLGDCKLPRADSGGIDHEIVHLRDECAYEHWHRMLFARFLAENNLLIEPELNAVISLAEAEELAKEAGVDVWVFASRSAQHMLPQIFRPDDPLLQVSFATEHRIKLENLLASLPAAVFTASDALGWVYQFWQSKKKEEVNRSEVKIGANEIAAVTQLFTEPYMVEFLLHNTLGAWWAGNQLREADLASANSEDDLRRKLALPGLDWEYLRFVRGDDGNGGPWRPAAGTFDGWPKAAAEIKVLDPCCGSGHFLVAALRHLVPTRMAEEGLSAAEAVDAVLRENLHGLEIDERCCQIAAFALALAAWTYPEAGGYRDLPQLHIACTGIGPQCSGEQWLKLADESGKPMPRGGRDPIHNGLLNLHQLFSQAPTLGSLINPTELAADVVAADYETIRPYLTAILDAERADDETRERAIAAAGMVKAAELLAGDYTLVITNVPYLGRGKQSDALKCHLETHFPLGKADLATAFVLRCLEFAETSGTAASVTPQNWLFLTSYKKLREQLLKHATWNAVTLLGEHAFESSAAGGAFVALLVMTIARPRDDWVIAQFDVSTGRGAADKAAMLASDQLAHDALVQSGQLLNADARIAARGAGGIELLSTYAHGVHGLGSKDTPCFFRQFWEIPQLTGEWERLQTTVEAISHYGGMEQVVLWDRGKGLLSERGKRGEAVLAGGMAWGKKGIIVSQMRDLPASLYLGDMFDKNAAVILPHDEGHIPAIWCYCESAEFRHAVRRIDRKVNVTNATLVKVPFDFFHWQAVAAEKYPDGLPNPHSDDPTQWLFEGDIKTSTQPLQVAVARLLGYRWPEQPQTDELIDALADDDGIVCIPSVRGEEPAAEQLLALLTAAGVEPDVDLDDWLRNEFFEQHCKLFHDRPFIWHIWDGRKRDGFHALVNYHKLCEGKGHGRRLLESLAYAYLGEWITRQRDGVKRGEEGAEGRLAAAVELQNRLTAIVEGEPPFDLFVRWKPLAEQPIGWEPDINDGVRLNIRPFLASDLPGGRTGAGVLRFKPNIKWGKDRGKEPERPKAEYPWFWNWDQKTEDFTGGPAFDGNRWNACHYTNKLKQAARERAAQTETAGTGSERTSR